MLLEVIILQYKSNQFFKNISVVLPSCATEVSPIEARKIAQIAAAKTFIIFYCWLIIIQ